MITGRALVTGGAGFIGSHLVDSLVSDGWRVTVVDNFDCFYDPAVKRANLRRQIESSAIELHEIDIRDYSNLKNALTGEYDVIVHLAAKAGVRGSIKNPVLYQDVNVRGTQNLLEWARERQVTKFVFASSSSVYGTNPRLPWSEEDQVLRPISPYASTKVSGELMGHVYSHLYGIQVLCLRFFTVFGPRQRPDLAIHKFARLMLEGRRIPLFGDGSTQRDYTFVRDVVQGIVAAISYDQSSYEVINLGNSRCVTLKQLLNSLEQTLGVEAKVDRHPEQPGDVSRTWANVAKAKCLFGWEPQTSLDEGLTSFANWLYEQRRAARVGAQF